MSVLSQHCLSLGFRGEGLGFKFRVWGLGCRSVLSQHNSTLTCYRSTVCPWGFRPDGLGF